MGKAHQWLKSVEGSTFYKLMGSGAGNGFSIFPDLKTYCLLINWESKSAADRFFHENKDWSLYRTKAEDALTMYLTAHQVKGTWDGIQPFDFSERSKITKEERIVVLTRATIRKRYIPYFWSKVPQASAAVKGMPGHIFSKGVGELPLLHQATLSVWESKDAMHAYAYQHDSHIRMIQETRQKGWYSEEMFAEFTIVKQDREFWT